MARRSVLSMRRGAAALLFAALAAATARAAPPIEDTIAQRVLACTLCHGAQGRAARDGYYPRIAGKPADYLYRQLLNFRDGRRVYPLMTGLLDPLSDAYLREIAEHFASLELPYAMPPAPRTDPAALRRGEELVKRGSGTVPACIHCHGETLTGVLPAIPGLVGLPRDYLAAQLGAWRVGERRAVAPDCMAQVAQRLEPADLAAVADWLASQPVPQPARPIAALPAALPIPCGAAPTHGAAR
jgi:cytochrome c553